MMLFDQEKYIMGRLYRGRGSFQKTKMSFTFLFTLQFLNYDLLNLEELLVGII